MDICITDAPRRPIFAKQPDKQCFGSGRYQDHFRRFRASASASTKTYSLYQQLSHPRMLKRLAWAIVQPFQQADKTLRFLKRAMTLFFSSPKPESEKEECLFFSKDLTNNEGRKSASSSLSTLSGVTNLDWIFFGGPQSKTSNTICMLCRILSLFPT